MHFFASFFFLFFSGHKSSFMITRTYWSLLMRFSFNKRGNRVYTFGISMASRVEVPEKISAEQRCLRGFINFSVDQRCSRAVQRWFSLNEHCSALDQNELGNR